MRNHPHLVSRADSLDGFIVAGIVCRRLADMGLARRYIDIERIVYIAHGWHYISNPDSAPLCRDGFVAATEGPVSKTIRRAFKPKQCAVTDTAKPGRNPLHESSIERFFDLASDPNEPFFTLMRRSIEDALARTKNIKSDVLAHLVTDKVYFGRPWHVTRQLGTLELPFARRWVAQWLGRTESIPTLRIPEEWIHEAFTTIDQRWLIDGGMEQTRVRGKRGR